MTTSIQQQLDRALDGRHLLEHPFYRRWEAGGLDLSELTEYAQQYRYFETYLPTFLSTVAHRLPESMARDSIEANLRDEISAPTHLELFEEFAGHYDADPAPVSPAMLKLLMAYESALELSDAAAIAGLLAYESQGAEVAFTKALGLAQHYGASDDALEFWRVHAGVEDNHAAWTLDALAQLEPESVDVHDGASMVAQAWWEFLDERELVFAS